MKHRILLFFVAFIIASCTSSIPYGVDYPLTNETFHSLDGIFDGRVPDGWFCSSEDSIVPPLILWFIKQDYGASITFQELHLDRLTMKRVEEDGFILLAQLSIAFRQDSIVKPFTKSPEKFKISNREFCSYEIKEGGNQTRVVVFSLKGKYYECVAMPLRGPLSPQENARLFTVQQSLLSSLSIR